MKDCFISKLNGEILDKSVERFNSVSLFSTSTANHDQKDKIIVHEDNKTSILSDQEGEVNFYNGQGTSVILGTPASLVANANYTLRTIGEQHFYIDGIDNVKHFEIGNYGDATNFYLGEDSRNLAIFNQMNFEELIIRRQYGIKGTLEELVEGKTNIKELIISTITNSVISGNILCLANNLSLISFKMPVYDTDSGYQLSLTGDIAELADMMAAHRTSGKMAINVRGTNCANSGSGNLSTYINFTSDTATYPRGWYETDS